MQENWLLLLRLQNGILTKFNAPNPLAW